MVNGASIDYAPSLQAERAGIISEIKPLAAENRQYNGVVTEKIKEMEPLRNSLGKFRDENNAMWAQSAGLCSSIEELDQTVRCSPFETQLLHAYIM
jgi:hypothetical protein